MTTVPDPARPHPAEHRLNVLYTGIGRGHPFYLDGIVAALEALPSGLTLESSDVFTLSRGLSRIGWATIRRLYLRGSSPGPTHLVYRRLRRGRDYGRTHTLRYLLGRNLRARYLPDPAPVIVAHPLLVALLRGKGALYYQHGEVVTPPEAVVHGASRVFVPVEEAAGPFLARGYSRKELTVTGLCIEPALVEMAEPAFRQRLQRYAAPGPLCGGYFSSGAEPAEHVQLLVRTALSALRIDHRVAIVAARGGRVADRILRAFQTTGVEPAIFNAPGAIPGALPQAALLLHDTRGAESQMTARVFAEFDYFVAPAHERANWALGLGLPMFILCPQIGPFAPLNRRRLEKSGVALAIDSHTAADRFGQLLLNLRLDGRLHEMAQHGWGQLPIRGFEVIARMLCAGAGDGPGASD